MTIHLFINILSMFLSASASPEGVNFEHKRINKEIRSTYQFTEFELEEIVTLRREAKNGETLGKYYKIESSSSDNRYIYIGRVFTCPQGGCDENINSSVTTEYFDYILLFDKYNQVKKVTVINYQATHGQEVCSRGWLKQFIGADARSDLKPGKNIDAISGATKSVGAMASDISLRLKEIDILSSS